MKVKSTNIPNGFEDRFGFMYDHIDTSGNTTNIPKGFEDRFGFMYDHIDTSGNNFRVYFVLTKWDTSEYCSVIDDCDYYVICDNLRTIMNSNDMRESIHYNIEYHNNCVYLIAVNNDKSIDFIIDHLCINTDKEELKNKIYNKLKGYFSPDYQKDPKEVKQMEKRPDPKTNLKFWFHHVEVKNADNYKVYFKLSEWDGNFYGDRTNTTVDDLYKKIKKDIINFVDSTRTASTLSYYIDRDNEDIYFVARNEAALNFLTDNFMVAPPKDVIIKEVNQTIAQETFYESIKETQVREDKMADEKSKSTAPSIMDTIRIIKDKIDKDKKIEEDMHDAVDVITPKEEVKPTMDPHVKHIKDEIEYQVECIGPIVDFVKREVDRQHECSKYIMQYAENADSLEACLRHIVGAEYTAIEMLKRLANSGRRITKGEVKLR